MGVLRRLVVLVLALGLCSLLGVARADDDPIPPGTVITTQNWQQYQKFMPDGMVGLFQGTWFWKMPQDVQIPVGKTIIYPLGKGYVEASEKYGSQTQVLHEPDGHFGIANYVAGMPFPNPQEPDKGYKILANVWYPAEPHLLVLSPETGLASFCTQDRYGNRACTKTAVVYRQLAYNSEAGVPRTEPDANGAWYTEWLMVEEPEQSRYTADLTIFYQDLSRVEDNYVFVPALRRSLRLSVSARCAPLLGSDMTHDDQRGGYNGGLSIFQAKFLQDRKILALTDLTTADGDFPGAYDMPLGWSKPTWGNWSVRDTYEVQVNRIPSEAAGYCYGKRIMYVDQHLFHQVWEELYDSNGKLWKLVNIAIRPQKDPTTGEMVPLAGSIIEQYWDVQNDHASYVFTADPQGRDLVFGANVPAEYNDINKYSTPGGLMQIMR